jgi:hypothetical protein
MFLGVMHQEGRVAIDAVATVHQESSIRNQSDCDAPTVVISR